MFTLGGLFFFFIILYYAITRIVPQFLKWIIKRCYHIEARIGRIGIPYITLHDVLLSANGFTVEIDQIRFRSSFLSSEVTKLVSVIIHDVRVNKDMMRQFGHSSWRPPDSVNEMKIPPLIITVAQFVSLRLLKVTCVIVAKSGVFHCTLSEVNVDASVVHSTRSLLVSAGLGSIDARLLRQASPKPSLTHIAASLLAEATLIATTPFILQEVDITFKDIKTVTGEDFFSSSDSPEEHWNKSGRKLMDYKLFINATAPILPKRLSITFDKCVIMDAMERDMTFNKLLIHTTFISLSFPICGIKVSAGINVVIEGLDMKSVNDTYLVLNQFSCHTKFDEIGLIMKTVVKDFSAFYDQTKMDGFLKFLSSYNLNGNEENKLMWPDLKLKLEIELWNMSATTKFHHMTSVGFGFSHLEFIYDSFPVTNGGRNYNLLSESVWCQLNKVGNISTLRKEHTWGTAIYVGLIMIESNPVKLEAMIDTFRLEWSPPFADILSSSIRQVRTYIKARHEMVIHNEKQKFLFIISFTNINLFFTSENRVCLMLRIDTGNIDSNRFLKNNFDGEGIKLISIKPTTKTYFCVRSSDIKGWFGQVDGVRMEWSRAERLLVIKFSHNIHLQWSPNLHLKLMEMYYNFKRIDSQFSCDESSENMNPLNVKLHITFKGNVKLGLKLSKHHNFILATEDFTYSHSSKDCSWSSSILRISVDGADIFTIDSLNFLLLHDHDLIRAERVHTEEFKLLWNQTWHVNMKSVKAIFPYEHNFSAAFQDDFITTFKWLKCLHRSKASRNVELPRDLFIEIQEFVFEMSDDPFEVRLRDNYELLEDEYKENLKRQKMLEEKINEMWKTHLLIPAGKVDELYATLSVLSAGIYVKRSKQMKVQGTRTRLFAWIISDFHLLALTDPSIHGPDNVVKNMTHIDPDSPWPSEGMEFSTLWCRCISVNCKELKFHLRDFPQPWLNLGEIQMWGKIVGAEQIPTRRAKRLVKLELGEPWDDIDIERAMTSLKFYHDLNCEIEHFSYAFGPCWEPVIAQCNLSFEKIVRGSQDPSPPLPLWDKLRLLLHGRVTMIVRQLTVLLHASLDPYNKTEEMEITWSSVAVDWTNAKVVFKGDLDIYVRTASKYDDCRLLHLPNLRLSVKLNWVCLGDPNDHHSVMPCAPDKLPDYSSNQEHDSFRAFRSQNLNISLALETKPIHANNGLNDHYQDSPVALLYGSTLRWFENLKLILSGVTRPTRRGTVFKTVRPRKLPLSRHYRRVHLLLSLHTFQVHYWMSFAMQRGFELTAESIAFTSEHLLSLVPVCDGLKHRPRAEWSVIYMTCELGNAEIWLRSALHSDKPKEKVSLKLPLEKCYFLSVGKVSYGREASGLDNTGTPTHRLVVYGLKGAWTTSNRDVVFALFDTFMKTKQLKKNLSTEALRSFRGETNRNVLQSSLSTDNQTPPIQGSSASGNIQATPSPMSKLQCGHAATMLQQLIAEADTKAVVFSDEPTTEPNEQQLQGLAACQHMDDVIHKNWLIALVNSQVLLKGPETKGYIIISASKAEILQRVHRPLWKDRTLVTKTTWVGSLQSMQYYATVSAGESDSLDENIMWLSVDNIKEKDDCVIAELPDVPQLVGSGQSVGGVVSETVGASSVGNNPPLQLQRIVSRCKCEFFYVCYGESSMSTSSLAGVPTPPCEDTSTLWEHHHPPVDAFTLMHHDLEVCTNSLQYAMLLDIVNNLLLYVEISRKKAFERLQRMRFQLQLQSIEDQRKPIQETQTRVRALLCKLRGLEKEMYLLPRTLGDEPNSQLLLQMDNLERQVYNCKEALTASSEELDTMLSCYKETQLIGQKMATLRGDKAVSVVRASEICFKHAQWRLTEADGQLGIADLVLSSFLYTKNSKSDDSVEHLLELGYVKMSNLLPNQIYKEVLQPTEIHNNMPIDRKRALRVFCREKAPVGGISVKEHFEINLVPLTIGLTKKFYNKMLKFCFPERETEENDLTEEGESTKRKVYTKGKDTNFYVPIERKDDVEKMKERAEKNKLFIYIKIPEVPVHVSYKGTKEKNLEDIRDFSLVIPTLEYHNVTWTWLDLLLAMKSDSRKVILSQAIKQKLQIKIRTGTDESSSPQEEDKARMLFGNRHAPGESKSLKRKFKFPK